MNNNQFLQQGEIFSNSNEEKKTRLPKINYRPSKRLRTIGIVSIVAVAAFSVGLMIPSERSEAIAQQANQAIAPADNQLTTHTPPIWYVGSNPPPAQNPNPTPPINFNQAGQDVIAIQQQINTQMNACAQNAGQAQAAVNQLRAREAQLEAQREDLNARIRGIDSSTPAGRDARRQLQFQRDQLEDERSNVRRGISDIRRQFSDFRSDCRRRLNDLRSQKRRAESAQQRGFNDATNLDTSRTRVTR